MFSELSAKMKKGKRKAITEHYDNNILNKTYDNPKEYWNIINGVRGVRSDQK